MPRGFSIEDAAAYLGCSPRTVRRLIDGGHLSIVRLPIAHRRRGTSTGDDTNRRIILDRAELDDLIVQWREKLS